MTSPIPQSLSSSSHVYFPQQGSHAVHALDTRGELRTAMIVRGDRLIFLKQGALVAESNSLATYVPTRLLVSASASPASSRPSVKRVPAEAKALDVYHVSICIFSLFSFRVAVATNAGILLFELDDTDEVWRNTSSSSELLTGPDVGPSGGDRHGSAASGVGVRSVEALHGVRHHYTGGSSTTGNSNNASSQPAGAAEGGMSAVPRSRGLRCQLIGIPPVINHLLPAMAPLAKGAIPPLGATNPLGRGGRTNAASTAYVNATNVFNIRVRHQPAQSAMIRRVEFASEDTLCTLSQEEVVLLRVCLDDNKSERIVGLTPASAAARREKGITEGTVLWRSIGTYQKLAVCPVNHHIALTLPGSTVVVFPCKPTSSTTKSSTADSSYAVTPAFPPTMMPSNVPGFSSSSTTTSRAPTMTSALREELSGPHLPTKGVGVVLSERGLTTSLGSYLIRDMRWHRVSTHTLLCVTCAHPEAPTEDAVMALFTVQSLPVLPPFTNVESDKDTLSRREDDPSCGHPIHREGVAQLIPAGTIPLSHFRAVPRGPSSAALKASSVGHRDGHVAPHLVKLQTRLVPVFSRSSRVTSLGNELTFLHVEGDGTVRTSSYRFGHQRHASFAKQRAEGHIAARLLAPLLALYGALSEMQVLPAWRSRTVEFGAPLSGTAQLFMNTRRYRFVATFETGVMAVVMVDLTALVYKVECFLTLGAYRVTSLLSFATPSARASVDGGDGSETLVAALLHTTARGSVRAEHVSAALTPQTRKTSTEKNGDVNNERSHPHIEDDGSQQSDAFSPTVCPRAAAVFAQRRSEFGLQTQLLTVAPLTAPDDATAAGVSQDGGSSLHITCACAMPDGILLGLTRRHVQRGAPAGTLSDDATAVQFVVVLPPVSVESLAPTQAALTVGAVCIPRTQTARLLRVPATFECGSQHTRAGEDWRVEDVGRSGERSGLTEADAALLRRARRHFSTTSCSNAHCGVLQTDQVTHHVGPLISTGKSSTAAIDITVSAALLDGAHVVRVPLTDPHSGQSRTLLEVKSKQLVNNDIVLGVRLSACDGTSGTVCSSTETSPSASASSQLLLFGLTTAQRVCTTTATNTDGAHGENTTKETSATFVLEHTVSKVSAFFLGGRGEVLTVLQDDYVEDVHAPTEAVMTGRGRQSTGLDTQHIAQAVSSTDETLLVRWLRCFPTHATAGEEAHAGYHYVQDHTWYYTLATPTASAASLSTSRSPATTASARQGIAPPAMRITACDALCWSGVRPQRSVKSFQSTQLLFATSTCDSLLFHDVPFASGLSRLPDLCTGLSAGLVSSYHPDAVMQLVGMARWDLVRVLLERLAGAIQAALYARTSDEVTDVTLTGPDALSTAPTETAHPRFDAVAPNTTLAATCLANRLCTSVISRRLRDTNLVSGSELATPVVCPPSLTMNTPEVLTSLAHRGHVSRSGIGLVSADGPEGAGVLSSAAPKMRFADVFSDQRVLSFLSESIPQVNIEGLSSGAQLGLLCIVEALSSVGVLSRNVDEAATRFFFLHQLASLRRRLRLPEHTGASPGMASIAPASILFFEQGKTAARAVTTASYTWAALSDSQAVLTKTLFFSPDPHGVSPAAAGLTWETVERSGAAYWLQSVPHLRILAEQIARAQYQRDKSLVDCTLMYCVAQKVSTLAALYKQQGNTRLQAFFQRDFRDAHNREAASANAFAAVGKNMPLYGAAFFLLAGDVRSASQVILQRTGNAALALFVLRAGATYATPSSAGGGLGLGMAHTQNTVPGDQDTASTLHEDLQWYRRVRHTESSTADVDIWEDVCLSWLESDSEAKIDALQRLARHPTGHPEVLSVLRYVREGGVVALAHRGERILPATQEVVCLARLSRFCFTRRLLLPCGLHLHDAETMLARLRTQHAQAGATQGGSSTQLVSRRAVVVPTAAEKPTAMTADFASGTLAFKGFESDDDDDDGVPSLAAVAAAMGGTRGEAGDATAPVATTVVRSEATASAVPEPATEIDLVAVCALRAELQYMSAQVHRLTAATVTDVTSTAPSPKAAETHRDKTLYALLSTLFLSTVPEAYAMTKTQWCLSSLLEEIEPEMRRCEFVARAEAGVDSDDHQPPIALHSAGPHTHQTFVCLLHLSLAAVALRARHVLLAYALTRVPTDVHRLSRCVARKSSVRAPQTSCRAAVHPCTAFFVVLFHHMRAELMETVDASCASVSTAKTDARLTPARQAAHLMDPLWLPAPVIAPSRTVRYDGQNFEPPELENAVTGTAGGEGGGDAARDDDAVSDDKAGVGAHKSIFDTLMASVHADEARLRRAPQRPADASTGEADRDSEGYAHGPNEDGTGGGGGGYSVPRVHATDEELSAALFSLSALHHYWRVLSVLRGMTAPTAQPPTSTAQDTHVSDVLDGQKDGGGGGAVAQERTAQGGSSCASYSPCSDTNDVLAVNYPFAGWLMVCCAANVATLRFNALADELVARLMCADWTGGHQPDVSVLTDPNGVLLEMELTLKQTSLTLCTALGTAAAELTVARVVAQETRLRSSPTPLVSLGSGHAGMDTADNGVAGDCVDDDGDGDGDAVTESVIAHTTPTWQAPPYTFFSESSLLTQGDRNASVVRVNPQLQADRHQAVLLYQLCCAYAEVFWQFPTNPTTAAFTAQAMPSRSLMRALREAALQHHTVTSLLAALTSAPHSATLAAVTPEDGTTRPQDAPSPVTVEPEEEPLWCVVKSSWLRRHHTHLSLRHLLLHLSLSISRIPPPPPPSGSTSSVRPSGGVWIHSRGRGDGALQIVAPTDRLVLRVCPHSVHYIDFDHSSCDSLVWSNEAGTGVDYGVRELFAGDNEWPLEQQLPERSMATRIFSAGLAAAAARLQRQRPPPQNATPDAPTSLTAGAAGGTASVTVSQCARLRPLMGTAPLCAPSSHPHLPFFLANHRDGHIDLYPFASPECVACYSCPNHTTPITRTSFSPNGYLFAVGVQDGSIVVWHFTAEAVNAAPRHCFTALFAPYAVRSVFFAGGRSSILCASGAVLEPHFPVTRRPLSAHAASTSGSTALTTHTQRRAGDSALTSAPVLLSPHISGYASGPTTTTTATTATTAASSSASRAVARHAVGQLLLIDIGQDEGHVLVRCALPFLPEHAVFIEALDAVLCVSLVGYMALYEVRTGQLTLVGTTPLASVLAATSSSGGTTPTSTTSTASTAVITAVAASGYDALVAIGTSTGQAFVLTVDQIARATTRAKARAEDDGDAPYAYHQNADVSAAGVYRAPRPSGAGNNEPTVEEELAQRAAAFFADRLSSSLLFDATVLSFTTSTGPSVSKKTSAASQSPFARASSSIIGRKDNVGVIAVNNPVLFPPCAILDLRFTPSTLLAGLKDGKVMGISLISQGLRHMVTAYKPE